MPFSALRSWRRPSNGQSRNHKVSTCTDSLSDHKTHLLYILTGKSLPSVFRMQRNPSRLWMQNVPLWKRQNRDCRVKWKTWWSMWRELMPWLLTSTRSKGTLTRLDFLFLPNALKWGPQIYVFLKHMGLFHVLRSLQSGSRSMRRARQSWRELRRRLVLSALKCSSWKIHMKNPWISWKLWRGRTRTYNVCKFLKKQNIQISHQQ